MQTFLLSNELLSAPLFQGMSRTDVQDFINILRLSIVNQRAGSIIARADTSCDHLTIVIHGDVTATTSSADRSYRLTETLSAPLQLQVEHLFGRRMMYSSTFRAKTPCEVININKKDVLQLYNSNEVFRLNLLNTLVVQLQKAEDRNWACSHYTLQERIVLFILRHSTYPAGEKWLKITMKNLATELNDSRLNVSHELNSLQREGLIRLTRGEIYIPALEKLYNKTVG